MGWQRYSLTPCQTLACSLIPDLEALATNNLDTVGSVVVIGSCENILAQSQEYLHNVIVKNICNCEIVPQLK